MKPDLERLFPDDISDKAAALLSEFLHSLAAECESHYFTQLRRYYARQQIVLDLEHPWVTPPPDR